jgi:hypothetical protein
MVARILLVAGLLGAFCPGGVLEAQLQHAPLRVEPMLLSSARFAAPEALILPDNVAPWAHGRAPTLVVAEQEAPTAQLILGGLAGGALGLYAGAYAGNAVERAGIRSGWWNSCIDCWVSAGPVLGAAALESVGVPLGVHLANGRRGQFWSSALLSLGIGTAAALLSEPTSGASLLIAPVAQIYTSIRIERATSRSR